MTKRRINPTQYTLEKGVIVPPKLSGTNTGRQPKYPFWLMKKGESFTAPASEAKRVRAAAANWKRKHAEFDYTSRVAETDGSIRVWRTA